MDIIIKKFRGFCNTASDINEQLPTLFRYAKQCNSEIEFGRARMHFRVGYLCGNRRFRFA